MRKIIVGFLGCGNIGCGVWKLLNEFGEELRHRSNVEFVIRRILVRDVNKVRDEAVPQELLTTDPKQVTDDPEIEMVLEFMGGEEPATRYMLRALEMGKTVVTANKMALALNWHLLQEEAEKHSAGLYYEAAVCGAIPVIRTTVEGICTVCSSLCPVKAMCPIWRMPSGTAHEFADETYTTSLPAATSVTRPFQHSKFRERLSTVRMPL